MDKTAVRFARWSWIAAMTVLAPASVRAQTPVDTADAPPVCNRRGRVHRMFHHTAHTVQDKIGRLSRQFHRAAARLLHQRTIRASRSPRPTRTALRSTIAISCRERLRSRRPEHHDTTSWQIGCPAGRGRILIEWTPEQPELAEARRLAVVDTLQRAGQPALAERVVIGPSPYPGARGVEAANNYTNTVLRSQMAGQGFALPPTESASMGVR